MGACFIVTQNGLPVLCTMHRLTAVFAGVLFCRGSALDAAISLEQRSSGKAGMRTKASHRVEASTQLGVMSKAGVTRYSHNKVRAVKSANEFYWASTGGKHGKFGASSFTGPVDLVSNISWAWHHPNGVHNTILIGAPLIDDQMNIYVASDDAIRKFDTLGTLLWSYGPRGQLATAPSLVAAGYASSPPQGEVHGYPPAPFTEAHAFRVGDSANSLLRVGDKVEVLPGKEYHAKGKEYYKTGDVGEVTKIVASDRGEPRAIVKWPRTGHASSALLSTWQQKFVRKEDGTSRRQMPALYGSTVTGYAFAIDLNTGDELWATKLSAEIAGVKGTVAAQNGIFVAASDKCHDRYCYRYRNESISDSMAPSNRVIRGLNSVNGTGIWSYTPDHPVWNFDPQLTGWGAVLFQDFQGGLYCLNLTTGEELWKHEGQLGMYTQAAAIFSAELNYVFSITESAYDSRWCDPYTPPGILIWCNTVQDTQGIVRGYHAQTGVKMWETFLPMPPTGASLGTLNSGDGRSHLVVGMGLCCKYGGAYGTTGKPSELWALSGMGGGLLWRRVGPTLWTPDCAGDKEGEDIRRAMGIRPKCQPNSWSNPVIDANGDVYVGSHVGILQKWGSPTGQPYTVDLLSSLETGSALLDQSIAVAPGMMAISTCRSLIVLAA